MISVISPAKTLNFDTPSESNPELKHTLPRLLTRTDELVDALRKHNSEDLQQLMGISENIATLNVKRYKDYQSGHTTENAKASVYAFKGDVYTGLAVDQFSPSDVEFSQSHLRILSGLYGLLRPLDLMQPYRLEMNTRLKVKEHLSLYNFWGNKIVELLLQDLENKNDNIILNLASNEYFRSIKSISNKNLKTRVINVDFLNAKNGKYKVISFFTKKARGMMAKYIIQNKIHDPQLLQGFDSGGYYFDTGNSSDDKFIFKREQV